MTTENVINGRFSSNKSVAVGRVEIGIRWLLGALLVFSVANAFLKFAPEPEMPAAAKDFFSAMVATGYFLPLLKGTELAVAIALLLNRFVPLALVVLAPITINIALFHAFLAPAEVAVAIVMIVMHLSLAWFRRESYRELLRAR